MLGHLPHLKETTMKTLFAGLALAAACTLAGCASPKWHPGPPHPGAVNPYSNGGFHDAGPNYPETGP